MKKVISTVIAMLIISASAPAQGFLGKLSKAINSVTETKKEKPTPNPSQREGLITLPLGGVGGGSAQPQNLKTAQPQKTYLDNAQYKISVSPNFDVSDVRNLGGEHFAILAGDKLTYYRMDATTVSDVLFDNFDSTFENGFCVVKKDGKFGILKDDGTLKMLTYRNVQPFQDGLAVASVDFSTNAIIDYSGKVVFTGKINKIGRLHCGRRLFYDSSKMKWGYMDSNNRIVIPAKFAQAGNFSDNVAFVKDDRFSGSRYLINTSGAKQPLDCSAYTQTTDFVNGKCVATIEFENQRVIDKSGKVLMESTTDTPRYWMSALDNSGEIFYIRKIATARYDICSDVTGKTYLDIGDMEARGFRQDAFSWDMIPYTGNAPAANLHSLRFINDTDIAGASYIFYMGQKNVPSMTDMTISYDLSNLYTVGNSNKRLFLIKLPDTPVIEFVRK